MIENRMMTGNRVDCLYRVSTDKQVDYNDKSQADIPMQRRECHRFCEKMGWTIVHEVEMSRNVQSGNTQNLKSTVIQRSFPKWSVAERRKTAAASDQAAVCACAHSRYFAGGSPSGLRV